MTARQPGLPETIDDGYGDELQPGAQLLHGQYTVEGFLNSGGFGITYLARDSLRRRVVIKECFPESMCTRMRDSVRARSRVHTQEFKSVVRLFWHEAQRLSKLDHPNIVGVHQVFEDNDTAYMALDFVKGRDLLDILESEPERLNPDTVKAILLRLLDAIAYIHGREILHRDISPDNILLDDNDNPVLIDFGAAREEASRKSRVLSTMHVVKDGYSPQEFYLAGSKQNASSDLYSLAATFYHVIVGTPPPNSQARVSAIASGEIDPFQPALTRIEGYDGYFLAAIEKALNVFPKDRVQSAREWIEEIDTEQRRRAMEVRVTHDREIEVEISKLVAEVNEAVLARQVARDPAPGPAETTAPDRPDIVSDWADLAEPVDPEPEAAADAAWDELAAGNDETEETDEAEMAGAAAAAPEPAPRPAPRRVRSRSSPTIRTAAFPRRSPPTDPKVPSRRSFLSQLLRPFRRDDA